MHRNSSAVGGPASPAAGAGRLHADVLRRHAVPGAQPDGLLVRGPPRLEVRPGAALAGRHLLPEHRPGCRRQHRAGHRQSASSRRLYTTDPRNPTQQLVDDNFGTDVYAVFGQLAYDVTDTIEASFALRYDREERDVHSLVPTMRRRPRRHLHRHLPGWLPRRRPIRSTRASAPRARSPTRARPSTSGSPKLAVTWDATDYLTAYASVGVGFKSGGFNNSGSAGHGQRLHQYSIVIRTLTPVCDGTPRSPRARRRSGRILLRQHPGQLQEGNVDVLRGRPEDRTCWTTGCTPNWPTTTPTSTTCSSSSSSSVPSACCASCRTSTPSRSTASRAASTGLATDWLELYAGATWIDSNIDKNNARPDTVGNESPYTPEWTASLGGHVTWPISEGLNLIADVDVNAVGDTWFHVVQDQQRPTVPSASAPATTRLAQRDAYTLVNARSACRASNWSVVAFGTNIFDENHSRK